MPEKEHSTSNVFSENVQTAIGMRSRLIPTEVVDRLVKAGRSEEKSKEIVSSFIPEVLGKINKESMKSDALVYVSEDEVAQIVDIIQANWEKLANAPTVVGDVGGARKGKKKEAKSELQSLCADLVKECKLGKISPDIALFGRMMAERPGLNVEGAVQVAHAISTNKVNSEIDFYTAVDDLSSDDEMGAGMMGTIAFNSACFYRYSTVDLDLLIGNLGGDRLTALKAVEAFIKASIVAVPSGSGTQWQRITLKSGNGDCSGGHQCPHQRICAPVLWRSDEDMIGNRSDVSIGICPMS